MIAPAPNCGHLESESFTHVSVAELWMCPLCITSIGALYHVCTNCGQTPRAGDQLLCVAKAGLLCFACRREYQSLRRHS